MYIDLTAASCPLRHFGWSDNVSLTTSLRWNGHTTDVSTQAFKSPTIKVFGQSWSVHSTHFVSFICCIAANCSQMTHFFGHPHVVLNVFDPMNTKKAFFNFQLLPIFPRWQSCDGQRSEVLATSYATMRMQRVEQLLSRAHPDTQTSSTWGTCGETKARSFCFISRRELEGLLFSCFLFQSFSRLIFKLQKRPKRCDLRGLRHVSP